MAQRVVFISFPFGMIDAGFTHFMLISCVKLPSSSATSFLALYIQGFRFQRENRIRLDRLLTNFSLFNPVVVVWVASND